MPTTRRSARLASSQDSSSPAKESSPKAATGSKRKSDTGSSPAPKRGKKDAPKEQKTIEETMDIDQPEQPTAPGEPEKPSGDDDQAPAQANATVAGDGKTSVENDGKKTEAQPEHQDEKIAQPKSNETRIGDSESSMPQLHKQSEDHTSNQQTSTSEKEAKESASEQPQQGDHKRNEEQPANPPSREPDEPASQHKADQQSHDATGRSQPAADSQGASVNDEKPNTNGSAIQDHVRDEDVPSSILEKGIIYFFFRGRVGIDNPSEIQDISRSHLVLRPIPHGAKLGDGPIGPSDNKCRLLALPKKVLPTSGKDRFMTFVEKSHTSFPELKRSFLPADDYETKTAGIRHTPPAKPIAEGVYAITTSGRESHLAYMLTIPTELGDVQKDVGLREQGSFVVSCKNPQFPGPSYASLPQSPDYPKEILDEFRSLRWMPLKPKHLDYENTQFLLIGESGGIDKALDVPDDKKDLKDDAPKEEMERLEGEDEIRVRHLKGNDAIFQDLGVSKKDYSQVPTTWGE